MSVQIRLLGGFEVTGIAVNFEQAVSLSRDTNPTFAIMDVRLATPIDGIETTIELLRAFKIRSLFATAHSDEDTRARGQVAAPLGWINKPYSPAAIINALEKALGN